MFSFPFPIRKCRKEDGDPDMTNLVDSNLHWMCNLDRITLNNEARRIPKAINPERIEASPDKMQIPKIELLFRVRKMHLQTSKYDRHRTKRRSASREPPDKILVKSDGKKKKIGN